MGTSQRNSRDTPFTINYDPYLHRKRLDPTNYTQSIVNLVKGILGTGIFAMPQAFKHSGYVFGIILTFAVYILLSFCLHLLFRSMYYFCKKDRIPQVTYPYAVKEGFKIGPEFLRRIADLSPYMVNFFLITFQMSVLCTYVIFISQNILQVINIHSETKISKPIFMMYLIIPFLLLSFIRHLKYLAPFSNVANWFTLCGLIFMFHVVFKEIEPLHERHMFGEIKNLPFFLGTTMFSLLAIGVILSTELNMQDARRFTGYKGVLNQGMIIATVLNAATGFLGYWKYGERTAPCITSNLNMKNPLSATIKVLFSCALYFSYAIQVFPIYEILWEQYIENYMTTSQHEIFWQLILRSIIVLISFLIALCIPHWGLYISLLGSFCTFVLGIILPPLLDICIRWAEDSGRNNCIYIRNIIIIIFGLTCWVIGTYTALKEFLIHIYYDYNFSMYDISK